MEPWINKPFDRIAKEFAEEAPQLFLQILGIAGPEDNARLEPLRVETAPPVTMPDSVATLRLPDQEECTFHVEFFVRYRDEVRSKIARYGGSLAWQYLRPVKSVLLLLKSDGAPASIPEFGEYAIGATRLTHPFRTVKLWELDPKPVLDDGNPGLLPWALLMRLGRDEAARLGAIVAETRDEQWISRFTILGSLRYPRHEVQEMLGGPRMSFLEEIIEHSSLFQEERVKAEAKGLQKGLQNGLQNGMAAGKAEEARNLLRMALSRKYPGMETMQQIDRIVDVRTLESLLLDRVLGGDARAVVERAILTAAAGEDR